jgi:UDP:flavonoid glycosyltransferase YjiC (YdhE family)
MTAPVSSRPKRIVMLTHGSFGDLHPYIAIALELQRRGHDPVIATAELYREKLGSLGIEFAPLRPHYDSPESNTELMRRVMDLRTGPQAVVRELMIPAVRDMYTDSLALADGADLFVSHPLTFCTRFAAEKTGKRWLATILAPLSLFSVHDPPVLPGREVFARLRFAGPWLWKILFSLARLRLNAWIGPLTALRRELKLPDLGHPLMQGQFSPHGTLGLYSSQLAAAPPDAPSRFQITGFPFFDQNGDQSLSPEIEGFLAGGEPPIVFTLGSSAVHAAGSYYRDAATAAQRLGRRAVLLVGSRPENRVESLPPEIIQVNYAPFSQLFSRCAAIVHQGGVGTTGQAMRSGRPMIIVPYSHDQPDNADRIARQGAGRVLSRTRCSAATLETELRALLSDPGYAAAAARVGAAVQQETGAETAANLMLAAASGV